MKLHAFDVETEGKRFRALTRDKARKSLKKPVTITSINKEIDPNSWRYVGIESTTGETGDDIKQLHLEIRTRGFAIIRIPPIHRHFYVYDVALDMADIRVYSIDRELTNFNQARHRMEMSPKGEFLKGKEAEYVGELEIPNASSAKRLGLDFDQLQHDGFQIAFVSDLNEFERVRRYTERKILEDVPGLEARFGIKISDFRIAIRPVSTFQGGVIEQEKVSEAQGQNIDIHIKNTNQITNTAPDKSFLNSWAVKFLGFLTGVIALLLYFREELAAFLENY